MPDMTRRSLQPVLPRSPKVQNTRLASWISLAKYWINVVAPPSMELIATPASTIPSAETCFSRDRPRITTATAMEPRKDHREMPMPPVRFRVTMANAAPKVAP